MIQNPQFSNKYTLVTFFAGCPSCFASKIWVNAQSPRIGIINRDSEIFIPGYLINKNKKSVAMLSKDHIMGTVVRKEVPASIDVTLAEGIWDFTVEQSGAALELDVKNKGDIITLDADDQTITVQKSSKVTLSLVPRDGGDSIVHNINLIKRRDARPLLSGD